MARFMVNCESSHRLRWVFLLGVAVGCGPGHDFEMAPVRGVVRVNGAPLQGGRVMFAPVATGGSLKSGKPGFADIAADGSYVVSTYGHEDGAVVAPHWVTVLSLDSQAAKQQMLGASRVTAPQRQTVIADQENVIEIELSSNEIRRLGEGVD